MKKLSILTCLLVCTVLTLSPRVHAAVFDAGDFLEEGSGAIGSFGEILLSNPSAESVEFRGRYGLSSEWNVGAVLGFGNKNKKFRLGGEGVYNIVPDMEGQAGFSVLGSLTYLERLAGGGLQLRAAPIIHKKMPGWHGQSVTVYASIPLVWEARKGSYTTGAQAVVGSLFDLTESGRFYLGSELGVKISKSESYILFGGGLRLGEVRLIGKGSRGGGGGASDEWTEEDFKK
jgi:hypothetical protein